MTTFDPDLADIDLPSGPCRTNGCEREAVEAGLCERYSRIIRSKFEKVKQSRLRDLGSAGDPGAF